MTEKRTEFSVEDSIQRIGSFGPGQKLQIAAAALAWAIASFQVVLFSSSGVDPQLSKYIICTKAGGVACDNALKHPYPTMCNLSRTDWSFRYAGSSLVTEFDLVCGRTWLVYFAATCFFVGILLGCGLWHLLSDKVPPRRILHTSSVVAGVSGCLSATAPFLWAFILFRIVSGVGVAGVGMAAFVLASDITGQMWRPFCGLFLSGGFSAGAALATFISWVIPSWRWISLLGGIFSLALAAFSWALFIESPAWLLLHGRKGEATASLATIAFTNKTRPPEYPLADPSDLLTNPYRTMADVWRNPILRRKTTILAIIWCISNAAYYSGILLTESLQSKDPKGDGTAVQLAMTGFLYELLGIAAASLVAERLGRKYAVLGGLIQAGACLLGAGLTRGNAQRGLAVAGRFGLAAGLGGLYIISVESFPVVVQQPGLMATNYAARLGAIVSPWLAFAAFRLQSCLVPLLVSGATLLAAAALTTLLQETLGAPTYETLQEMNSATVKRHRSWTNSFRNVFSGPILNQPGLTMSPSEGRLPTGAAIALVTSSNVETLDRTV